jgi:hypothetical protein
MTPVEYDAYLTWVVADHAGELERNGRAAPETAVPQAQASFDSLLPRGLDTPDQVLLIAEDTAGGERVGLLWFGATAGRSCARARPGREGGGTRGWD